MLKRKKKNNFFIIAFGGAIGIVAMAFLFSAFAIALVGNEQSSQPRPQVPSPKSNDKISIYVVSGKITDIQGKTITLETPVFDFTNKRWGVKKEIRKLAIGNGTELLKNSYKWEEDEKEFEPVSEKIKFEDLKIGDRLDASYTKNLLEIKDFTPARIAIPAA